MISWMGSCVSAKRPDVEVRVEGSDENGGKKSRLEKLGELLGGLVSEEDALEMQH